MATVADLRTFDLPGKGVKCGNCGAVLPDIARTTSTPGFITRERICPECGKMNVTSERVIHTRDKRRYCSESCEE